MRVANWIVVSLGLGLVVLSAGCKPKVGGKCKEGAVVCTKEGSLFCGDDGKYVAAGCHGPAGCTAAGTDSTCDQSLSIAGDGCETEGNISCSTDKKAQLDCKNHKWVVGATCKGAKGCELRNEELFCDHTVADKDDPCHRDGQIACTIDKTFILKCQSNVMMPIDACRGPKSCTFEEHPERDLIEFNCDDSVAQEGDPCASDGFHACAVDKKAIHICLNKKFTSLKTCAGPKGCSVDATGLKLLCDQGSAGFFSGAGGTGKVSQAAGGEKKAPAKGKTAPSATASGSAKPATSVVAAAASGSAKPATSGSAAPAASGSAKPGASASASAAASASGKPAASAKPAASVKPPAKK